MGIREELNQKDELIIKHMAQHGYWTPIGAVHRNLQEAGWVHWVPETTGYRMRHLRDLGLVEADTQMKGFYRITRFGEEVAEDIELPSGI